MHEQYEPCDSGSCMRLSRLVSGHRVHRACRARAHGIHDHESLLSSSIRQRVSGFGGHGHAAGDTFESKTHGKVEGLLPVRLAPRMAGMLRLCSIQGIIVSS